MLLAYYFFLHTVLSNIYHTSMIDIWYYLVSKLALITYCTRCDNTDDHDDEHDEANYRSC